MLIDRVARTCLPLLVRWCIVIPLAIAWPPAGRGEDEGLEYAVKAAYLCKFPAFVAWPRTTDLSGAFVVCVVGQSAITPLLERAAQGQALHEQPVVVRHYASVTANPGCQAIFVAGSDTQSVTDVLDAVRGTPVLTVTDGQTRSNATGVINFVLADRRVRFEIDQQAATDNKLGISSKLLGLAVRVRNRTAP